jgi:hypothetical protein
MRKLTLTTKTGFRVTEPNKPIVIRDDRFLMFYTTEDILPRCTKFNLPGGTYYIDRGSFVQMKTPVKYKLTKLPSRQRLYPRPWAYKIEFGSNPNKCSILWDLKTILFDNSFKDKPLPEVFFVLFHEYGHALYGDEHLADLYAGNLMKLRGFNPLQIGDAPNNTLSSGQLKRKNIMLNAILKAERKK